MRILRRWAVQEQAPRRAADVRSTFAASAETPHGGPLATPSSSTFDRLQPPPHPVAASGLYLTDPCDDDFVAAQRAGAPVHGDVGLEPVLDLG